MGHERNKKIYIGQRPNLQKKKKIWKTQKILKYWSKITSFENKLTGIL